MGSVKKFARDYGAELREFFAQAQIHGYGELEPVRTADGGFMLTYESGIWKSVDLWYGGEPYSGMMTIFREGRACFSMSYRGQIFPAVADQKDVLACLAEALQHPRPEHPWRGPKKFHAENGMFYRNTMSGSVKEFSGQEVIMVSATSTTKLYEANYWGGIINMY